MLTTGQVIHDTGRQLFMTEQKKELSPCAVTRTDCVNSNEMRELAVNETWAVTQPATVGEPLKGHSHVLAHYWFINQRKHGHSAGRFVKARLPEKARATSTTRKLTSATSAQLITNKILSSSFLYTRTKFEKCVLT